MNAKNDLDVCASKNTHTHTYIYIYIYILVHAKFNEKLIFMR